MLKKLLNNNLFLFGLIIALVAMTIGILEVCSANTTNPSSIDTEKKSVLSKTAFITKYKKDKTLQLGGLNQDLFFLEKRLFLTAAEREPQKAQSIFDFKEVLENYLMTKSTLVQAVFGSDKEALWAYITEHNPDEIAAIEQQIRKGSKVHQLDNWNGLMVYKVEEQVSLQPAIAGTTASKKEEKPVVVSATTYVDIPRQYQAEIEGKLFRLELRNLKEEGDSLHFVYEVLGIHGHYNQKGTLNTKDGKMQFSSLGTARLKRRTTGQTKIIIEKRNYTFVSI